MSLIPGYKRVIIEGVEEDVSIDTHNFIWNTSTLAWERATGSAGAGNVTVTNFPATYPATQSGSWSVTANAGTNLNTSLLALEAGGNLESIDTSLDVTLSTRLADTTFTGRINTLGQKTMSNSTPVVLSSDQSILSVLASGAALESGGNLESINNKLNSLGQKDMSSSVPVVIANDQSTLSVSVISLASGADTVKITDGSEIALINSSGSLQITPDPTMTDAFGRIKVSDAFQLFGVKEDLAARDFYFNTLTVGGGGIAYNSSRSSTTLSVGTANGDRAVRQSRSYLPYSPGRPLTTMLTGVIGSGQTGTTKRCGLFDDNNGLFFELYTTTKRIVVRSDVSGSPVDTQVNQSSWNIDPMDGTGPSGITIDWTKTQIFIIDYQWLGVGCVRFGFVINGSLYFCHYAHHANIGTSVYMRTPNLPVRWEIVNHAGPTSGVSQVEMICSQVSIDGGFISGSGFPFAVLGNVAGKSIGTTLTPLIIIRPRSTFPRPPITITDINISGSNADFTWGLYLNPTLTGGTAPSYSVAHADSMIEYDIASTAAVSGGTRLLAGASNSALRYDRAQLSKYNFNIMNANYAGTTVDYLVLALQQRTGAANVYLASMGWEEFT